MCVFLLPSRLRLSSVSVVFDFNASLNDVAPVSPIWFSVYKKRKMKGFLLDVSVFYTPKIDFCECCV